MKSWNELLAHEVRGLHDAELQLVTALPKLAKAAAAPELKEALENHLSETRGHVLRLERVAEILRVDLGNIICAAMKRRIREGLMILGEPAFSAEVRDAALIGAARKVRQYEMIGYGSAIDHAGMLGHDEVVEILKLTLDEEMAASDRLSALGEGIAAPPPVPLFA